MKEEFWNTILQTNLFGVFHCAHAAAAAPKSSSGAIVSTASIAGIDRALPKPRCTTDDIAEVVLFLGFGAAMVTGQTITVDGGLTL